MSDLKHYKTTRETGRLLLFWSGRGLCEQSEANQSEILTRADALIDGLEMLVPQLTPAQRQLAREAIVGVQRVASLVHGVFVLEDGRS